MANGSVGHGGVRDILSAIGEAGATSDSERCGGTGGKGDGGCALHPGYRAPVMREEA